MLCVKKAKGRGSTVATTRKTAQLDAPPAEQESQASVSLAKKRRAPEATPETVKRRMQTIKERYDPEFYAQIGAKGGATTRDTKGKDYYSRIAPLGGQRGKGHPSLQVHDNESSGEQ